MEGGGSDWRPVKGEAAGMGMDAAATGDWRVQLKPEARGCIVNKIMDTLKRPLPMYGHEALGDLRNIARRFEERIFTAATNQSDYLRKISLKMLMMETKTTQNPGSANQMPSNSTSQNLPDPGNHNHSCKLGKRKRETRRETKARNALPKNKEKRPSKK